MRDCNRGRFRQQLRFLQRQFLQDGDLPFTDVLSEEIVTQAMETIGACWKERIYSPLVTLWVFLSQVLSQDHSCQAAVARLISHRVSRGQQPCSAETGGYCQARKRLPEEFFSLVARQTGCALEDNADSKWLWKERRVFAYDGSTLSMPDTAENQEAYPQPYNQIRGVGFPIARIAAFFSLSSGAIIDLAICRYEGKGQSELGMLRTLWKILLPSDAMLADRLMCSYSEMAMLKERGVDCVCRFTSHRKADFRRGKRLDKGDHIVKWPKPGKPRTLDLETYKSLPDFLAIRETRVQLKQPGFRIKTLIIATTLLDAEEFTKDDLVELYRARWNAELDIRSIKITMQMDILRCKTPELVRKEIWTHVLAYNLIRTIIAQAATKYDVEPRSISFKGMMQTLEAFLPLIATVSKNDSASLSNIYQQLLAAIATHRVANRPDRFEPRRRKRRPRPYFDLMKPRHEAKLAILKGLNDY